MPTIATFTTTHNQDTFTARVYLHEPHGELSVYADYNLTRKGGKQIAKHNAFIVSGNCDQTPNEQMGTLIRGLEQWRKKHANSLQWEAYEVVDSICQSWFAGSLERDVMGALRNNITMEDMETVSTWRLMK